MKKLFIVILYKMEINNSQTIQSFKRCNLFENPENYFFFWDNSPDPLKDINYEQLSFLGNQNVVYESHPENTPLAKAYNTIIRKNEQIDYFVIFDQDTEIQDFDYEKNINKILQDNPKIDLFIPKIYTKTGVLYSPGKFIFPGKTRKIKEINIGINDSKNLTGITSGLILSKNFIVSENFLFNEKLKLYGVDTDFFINYGKKRKQLYILPTTINHSLSFEDNTLTREEHWKRFKESINCYFNIYTKFYEKLIVTFLKIFYIIRHFIFK